MLDRRDNVATSIRPTLRTCFLLAIACAALGSQNPPDATFRTRVELVQISVIAQDKQGKSVADLDRRDFEIFDNDAPREIRLFVREAVDTARAGADDARAPKTRGRFTNQIPAAAGSHSGYAVILIDNLFTDADPDNEEGSTLARLRALQTLKLMRPGEHIAIYAIGRKFDVICEFTADRDLLERQLRRWKPRPDTPQNVMRPFGGAGPGAGGPAVPIAGMGTPPGVTQLPPTRGDAAADAAYIDGAQRSAAGDAQMEAIADHLAGIPGRKNMLFLSNRFLIGGRSIRKLIAAGVSIYPVDLDGVCRLCPERPVQLMNSIAAVTGGVAYFKRNDLDIAMREALDDGLVSYTLGFYPEPSDNDRPAAARRLVVKTTRPGVVLRYQTEYQTREPLSVSADPRAELVHTLNRPIDATAIPVTATVTKSRDRLSINAVLAAESLDLAVDAGHRTGRLEFVARFITAEGVFAADATGQTMPLNLDQGAWESAIRNGIAWRGELKIPPRAAELKLLFANLETGKAGTLTISLAEVPNEK